MFSANRRIQPQLAHLLITALAFRTILPGQSNTYHLAPDSNNKLWLEVEKTGLLRGKKHTFLFKSYSGTVDYRAAQPQNSRVGLVIDGDTMTCIDDWVSDHDREKILAWGLNRMIEVSRFPQVSFHSSAIMAIAPGKFEVTGMLTIRDVVRPVKVLIATIQESGQELHVQGSSEIHMKDFGLLPPSAAFGAIGTKETMLVQFDLLAKH